MTEEKPVGELNDAELDALDVKLTTPPEATGPEEKKEATPPTTEPKPTVEPEKKAEVPPEKPLTREEFAKLEKRIADQQLFIGRLGNELGQYRKKNNVDLSERKSEINKKIIEGDPYEGVRDVLALEEEQRLEVARKAADAEAQNLSAAMEIVPDLLTRIPDIRQVLIDEDKVAPELAAEATRNLSLLGDARAIYAFAKRAEAVKEIKTLREQLATAKAENEQLKGRANKFVKGVETALRQPHTLAVSAGGQSSGSALPTPNKPIPLMTDAELDEYERQLRHAQEQEEA